MSRLKLTTIDYPLAENRPDLVAGRRGKPLDSITLQAVLDDQVTMEDLSITRTALENQAAISQAVGRPTLAANLARAAELVDVPQVTIMKAYELLRPGRAKSKAVLLTLAAELRENYGARDIARFVEEAAEIYDRRGLFGRHSNSHDKA